MSFLIPEFPFLCRIVIDYSDLPEKYKDLFDPDEVRREGDRLQRHVNELSNTIQRIQAPNMRVCVKSQLTVDKFVING